MSKIEMKKYNINRRIITTHKMEQQKTYSYTDAVKYGYTLTKKAREKNRKKECDTKLSMSDYDICSHSIKDADFQPKVVDDDDEGPIDCGFDREKRLSYITYDNIVYRYDIRTLKVYDDDDGLIGYIRDDCVVINVKQEQPFVIKQYKNNRYHKVIPNPRYED